MKTGIELITEERQRQFTKGWTLEHDEGRRDGILALAAATIACGKGWSFHHDYSGHPFEEEWVFDILEKQEGNRIRQLMIAGALCAAEIDRLQREAEVKPLKSFRDRTGM